MVSNGSRNQGRTELEVVLPAHDGELFRRLVESVRDYAIFMLDPTGRVATWNIGAERIKGYRAHEIIGRHFSTFYPESDVLAGKCEFEIELATRVGRFEEEGWRVRKDGSLFWAKVVINAVNDDEGRLLGFSKVTQDLSERKKAEDRAKQELEARLAAEQSNRAKDEFLAMLGHELRNPLAPILTALQLLKLRSDHQPTKEQEVIERQVKHMMNLVDDLLDISRITRGKVVLKQQHLDLRDTMAKAVELAAPLLEQRRHHFDVEAPAREIVVFADEARLTQVFANLLLNAAKYTQPGGHITVTITGNAEKVSVAVRDDGIGIAPDLLPQVFDLFAQGYQAADRSGGGLGIGLALVRSLVHMHGGTVAASSAGVGQGSTFTILLPVVAPEAVVAAPAPEARRLRATRKAHRILVVDDNEDALTLLASVLSSVGHEVATAIDPAAALVAVKTFTPDFVILDIGLPVMDGYALAPLLCDELAPAKPRLIALTGYGQKSDRDRSRAAGFHTHLVKPVDTQRLLDAIGELDASVDP